MQSNRDAPGSATAGVSGRSAGGVFAAMHFDLVIDVLILEQFMHAVDQGCGLLVGGVGKTDHDREFMRIEHEFQVVRRFQYPADLLPVRNSILRLLR